MKTMPTATAAIESNEFPFNAVNPDNIINLGNAFRASKVLFSAVELGLFTALAKHPCGLDALRKEIGIAERAAKDFFDALVALGLLDRDSAGLYRNVPATDRYLDANKPTYMGDDLNQLNARGYPYWHHLTTTLKSGQPQVNAGEDGYFQTLYSDETSLQIFMRGMTGGIRLAALAIADTFPWRQYKTVIDVGTAQGCLPVQIARIHAHLIGGGFDLPVLRTQFDEYVHEHGLSDRLRFFPGDFFRDPLPRADVLVFGRVLHNWDLATKRMLLNKAYQALPTGGAIIVYERLIDDERRVNASALLGSLHMLLMTSGGFDFTGADCTAWMREAGFHNVLTSKLTSEISMVTGLK